MKKSVDILKKLCYNRNEKKSCKGNAFTQKESPRSCNSGGFRLIQMESGNVLGYCRAYFLSSHL